MNPKRGKPKSIRKLELSFTGTLTLECPDELFGVSDNTLQEIILGGLKDHEMKGLQVINVSTTMSTKKRKSTNCLIRSADGNTASAVKVVFENDRILLVGEHPGSGNPIPLAAVRHNNGDLGVYVWQSSENPDEKDPIFVSTRKGLTSFVN